MKKHIIVSLAFICMTLFSVVGNAAESVHWGYSGAIGPEHWAQLSADFAVCATGRNQSPIDIRNAIEGDLPKLRLGYHTNGDMALNNGHTIQVSFPSGNSLNVGGYSFNLVQVHFHAPSENTINGEHFPLEAHYVHTTNQGEIGVLAVMFEPGAENEGLAKIWSNLPVAAHQTVALTEPINAQAILPNDLGYYRFNGSLTTPPCSEGVSWFVLKTPATVSRGQLQAYRGILHRENNRPVQPLNARVVVQ